LALLGHLTPKSGEHSRLNEYPASLDHYTELIYSRNVDGVRILNSFVNYAIHAQRQNIDADLNVIVNNRLVELEGKIEAERSSYQIGKEARIATLQEDYNIKRAQLQDDLRAPHLQLKLDARTEWEC
jgi:hypothetical protein